jgi:hypothetical protein
MPQTYKTLSQVYISPNTVTNVYVTDASTTAIVSALWIYSQGFPSSSNVMADLILRPINESFNNKHFVVTDLTLNAFDTNIYNLAITIPPSTILAANLQYKTGEAAPPAPTDFIGASAFGVEIT